MNNPLFQFSKPNYTPGFRLGLSEPSAVLHMKIKALPKDMQAFEANLRANCSKLWPGEPICSAEWPESFLAGKSPPGNRSFMLMGEWVIALTIAMQRLNRDLAGRGRVAGLQENVLTLALPWQRQAVFQQALQWSVRHLLAWGLPDQQASREIQGFTPELEKWIKNTRNPGMSANTFRLGMAALNSNLPVSHVSYNTLRLGWGINAVQFEGTFSSETNSVAVRLARDKVAAQRLLVQADMPVPDSAAVHDPQSALKTAEGYGWPVVLKPYNEDQGEGVHAGIMDEEALLKAFEAIKGNSQGSVLVQKHVSGDDHRLLVVKGSLLAAARRIPAGVTGDGISTVRELVDRANLDPRRGDGHNSLLVRLDLSDESLDCLKRRGMTPESVPEQGLMVRLRHTSNISTGGTARDVTRDVHPDNIRLAERAARVTGLDMAGVDFISTDITKSWRETGGAIIEVNAQPGLRPHWLGSPERDITSEILQRYRPGRIPTAAITGTNGKSTVALMLHHIWKHAGRMCGVTTTQGVWIGDELASSRNLSGHPGARMILDDPAVESAVMELPRKGLFVFGHPCDRYDVSALLNIQDDHIGVDGIDTLDQMARLKSSVLERAERAVVVNADDRRCLDMLRYTRAGRHILVSRDMHKGRECVFVREGWAVHLREGVQEPVMPLSELSCTEQGLLDYNEQNAMFAMALALAQGIDTGTVRQALASFTNSVEHNPGRCNWLEGFPFKVLLDFAHNPEGITRLCSYVRGLDVQGRRIGVIVSLGNRHRSHIDACAPVVARTFDRFIIGANQRQVMKNPEYQGRDPVGSKLEYLWSSLVAQGVEEKHISSAREKDAAIRLGLQEASEKDLVVLLREPWEALQAVQKVLEQKGVSSTSGA